MVCEVKPEFSETAYEPQVTEWLVVPNVFDADLIVEAVKEIERASSQEVSGILAVMEELQSPLARAQSCLGLPGLSPDDVQAFRKKDIMQRVVASHGFKTPRKSLVADQDDLRSTAFGFDFPVVVKPRAGVGTRNTHLVTDSTRLSQIGDLYEQNSNFPCVLEEHVKGVEACLTVAFFEGELVWDALAVYRESPLAVMNNQSKAWSAVFPPCSAEPFYAAAVSAAKTLFPSMGFLTGVGFIEFFSNESSPLVISEVAARPPSSNFLGLISYAKGFDAYADWAALFGGQYCAPQLKDQAVGALYIRAKEKGLIESIQGVEYLLAYCGDYLVDKTLPEAGQITSTSYEGDGYLVFGGEFMSDIERLLNFAETVVQIDVAPNNNS